MSVSNPSSEDITTRRRRMRYRAWHRGMQEMDIILGNFADAHLEIYDEAALTRLETLMDEQDADLFKWLMGQEPPPETVDGDLLREIIAFQLSSTKTR